MLWRCQDGSFLRSSGCGRRYLGWALGRTLEADAPARPKNVLKRRLMHVGGFNLSLVLRQKLGAGTPRGLAAAKTALGRLEKHHLELLTP